MARGNIPSSPKTQASLEFWQTKNKEQQRHIDTKEYINKAVTDAKEAEKAEGKIEGRQEATKEQNISSSSYNDKTAVLFRDGDLYDDSYDGFGGEWPNKQ